MAKQTKKKAFAYLRVSGKGQVNKDGFPRQRETIRKYAKANGLEIVGEYRDEGVSGTKELEQRQGLAALLDHIESNGVQIVLVERADTSTSDRCSSLIFSNAARLLRSATSSSVERSTNSNTALGRRRLAASRRSKTL